MSPFALKIVIVILFILMVISLFGGLNALVKNRGRGEKQNYLLGIRAALGLSLMAVLLYGIFSGKLGSKAPWDARKNPNYDGPAFQQPVDKKPQPSH